MGVLVLALILQGIVFDFPLQDDVKMFLRFQISANSWNILYLVKLVDNLVLSNASKCFQLQGKRAHGNNLDHINLNVLFCGILIT